jgi:type I restriction enzyme S subunit
MSEMTLPDGWRIVKLDKVADYINGYAFKPSDWVTQGLPIIRIQNLNNPSKPFNFYDGELKDRYRVRAGDILISWSASLGAYMWAGQDAWLNQHIFKAIVNEAKIDHDFFYWVMRRQIGKIAESAHGSTMKHVTRKVLLAAKIPLPTRPEQQAIAHTLRTVQQAREVRQRELVLERERKAALMDFVFTCGPQAEATTTQETRFGEVPKHWQILPLSACSFVQTGVTKGRKFNNDPTIIVPYLRVANVQDGHLDLSEIKGIRIRESELDRYRLQVGDVVLTEGGDFDKLGRGFIWQGEIPDCIHQNHVFAVRVNRELLQPEYFAYLVQSNYGKAYFLSVAHRTTNLASINSTKLKAFPTLIPPLTEQQEIINILQACDTKIAALERESTLLEELFRAMLEELMTGQIRIPEGDKA